MLRLLVGARNQSVKFDGTENAWETRKQSIKGGGSNMLRAGKWKATSEGTWEKSWICRRDKVPVLGRGEKKGWATIKYSPCYSELTCPQLPESCASQCIPHTLPYAHWT